MQIFVGNCYEMKLCVLEKDTALCEKRSFYISTPSLVQQDALRDTVLETNYILSSKSWQRRVRQKPSRGS